MHSTAILCEAKNEGLVHYPTALAPRSGSVPVTVHCADNAHTRSGYILGVLCTSSGSWSGTTPHCDCASGYQVVTVSGRQICQGELMLFTFSSHLYYSHTMFTIGKRMFHMSC